MFQAQLDVFNFFSSSWNMGVLGSDSFNGDLRSVDHVAQKLGRI